MKTPATELEALVQRFIEGSISLVTFRDDFRKAWLAPLVLDDMSQLFYDRVLEAAGEVGMSNDRLHDDPRLADEAAYREYLMALRKRYRDGTLTFTSPEY